MCYNISKNYLEIMNISLSKYNKKLNNEQLENLYYKLNNMENSENNYYIDSFKGMFGKIESSYYLKSSKRLEYFVKNNLKKFNIKTGEIKDYTYNNKGFKYLKDFVKTNKGYVFEELNKGEFLSNQDRLYSYKKISKVKYLEYVNQDKEKIFITFTLPNILFHKYNKNGELTATYKNKDTFEENIFKGLKYLNEEIHRYFYNTLKYKIKRYCEKHKIKDKIKIDFIKMLEPHKNLSGHLHSLFYIDKEFLEIIEEVYNMTINYFDLKQTKFEIIDNKKGTASSYVSKYLLKTTQKGEEFYKYYKRYFNNVKFFSCSNFRHTTQEKIEWVYRYLYTNKSNLLNRYKRSKKPLYYLLEKLILKNVFTFEEEEKTSIVLNYTKLKNEYKKTIELFEKDKSNEIIKEDKTDIIKDKNIEIDISIDKLEDLYFTIEHIIFENSKITKQNYIKRFQTKIIKNLNEYINITNKKVVSKMYYKDNLVLNKKDWEFEKTNITDLLNNPFENLIFE